MSDSMNATNNSSQEQLPAPAVTAVPLTTISIPPEHVVSSNVPYTATEPTPHAMMKMQSTLPPITMAQPLETINQSQSHLCGGSNIPVNPNAPQGTYRSGANSADPDHPYVTVVAMAPPGASGDEQVDNMRFAFLQKCRWMACCLTVYYLATFLFLQPFVLGTLGLLTALMGFHSSRSPVDMQRFKWLRWYIRANYVMLCLNMWMLVMTFVFSTSINSYAEEADGGDIANNNEGEYVNSSHYNLNSVNLFMMLLVAVNTIMHLRCLHMAQLLLAELLAAGVDHQPPFHLVLATNNPISAV